MKNGMIDTSAWIDFLRNSRGAVGEDVLISRVALRYEMAVLTLDQHFQQFSVNCLNIL